METRAHHVLIGAFTLLVAIGGLLFVLWLAKSSVDHAYAYYDVVFNESVTGLSKGGMVQYNGIKVGQVADLKLDPHDPRKVIARIQVAADTPVKRDTGAKLGLLGLTGVAFIQLTGGSPGSPPLSGHDDHVPQIVAQNSELSRLLNSGEDVASNANELLLRLQQLLSQRNVAHVEGTLRHLDQTMASVAAQRAALAATMHNLAGASAQLQQTLQAVQQLATQSNALLDSQGRATLLDVQHSAAALARMSTQLEQVVAENRGALATGTQGMAELGPTLRQMQRTLQQLDALTTRMRTDPAGYLLGRDAPQEYRPR